MLVDLVDPSSNLNTSISIANLSYLHKSQQLPSSNKNLYFIGVTIFPQFTRDTYSANENILLTNT